MEAYFFLSYARADDDGSAIAAFYQDLRAELARQDPEAAVQPVFRDVEQLFLGVDWERKLAQALGACRSLVALYSPAYFASVYCGKEWTAFRARATAYQRETGWDPGALLPVLWEPVPGGPPPPADELQYREPALGEYYAEVGLRRLLREDPGGPAYRQVVEVLAERVRLAASRVRLPGLPGLNLREFPGAFPLPPTGAASPGEPSAGTERQRPVLPGHLFVSYAPPERMWAEWAVGELTGLGYRTSLHSVAARPGEDARTDPPGPAEATWALAGQGRVLALLSPDYQRHLRAEALWRALAGREAAPGVPCLLPLRVAEADRPLLRLFAEQPAADLSGGSAPEAAARLAAAVGGPVGASTLSTGGARAAGARHPGELPAVLDVPARNTAFTGRDEVLEALRDGFARSPVQVVTGLGGVGKTQAAAEYAHRFRAGYDVIWWIGAGQVEYLVPRLAQLAPRLGLEGGADSADTAGQVLAALHRGEPYRRWLLVLDNAGDPAQLERWVVAGPAGGHLLITSRDPRWSQRAEVVELGVFQRRESLRLLRRLNPGLGEGPAGQVAEQLGDLPLAIAQAAAWLQESGMPVAGYLELLAATLTETLERTRLPAAEYPHSVAATWRLSLEELGRGNARAAALLEICAHFGAEPVPAALLFSPPLLGRLGLGPDPLSARLELGELVRTVHRTGLARADAGRETLTVHRLVQAVVRDQVPEERRGELRRTAQLALAAVAPPDPDALERWDAYAELLPHLWPSGAAESTEPEVRQLLVNAVRHLWQRGLNREARELAERTLECWAAKDTDGGRVPADGLYPGMLRVQLANVLRDLGEFQECYAIDRAALERFRRERGPRDLQTLVAACNLCGDLNMLARFEEARELGADTLEICEQALPAGHPRIDMVIHNLAVSEAHTGDWPRAVELLRRCLRRQRRGAPVTLRNLGTAITYGGVLRATSRLRESRELLEETMRSLRRTVSTRHWHTLYTRASLAATYQRLGRLGPAGELAEEAYQGSLEVHGPGHWDNALAAATLATVLRERGEPARAVEIADQAHRDARQNYGEAHPKTQAMAAELAVQLRAVDRAAEADTLSAAALAALTEALGPEHCCLGAVLVNHATGVAAQGDPAAAAELGQRAARLLTSAFGSRHHDILAAHANLALDLTALGHTERADQLRADCLRQATGALGEHHPLTRAARAGERMVASVDAFML